MKNIIAIVLLCIYTHALSQEPDNGNVINSNLSFGRFSDCLRPGGICTFKEAVEKKEINTHASYNTTDQTLTLHIDRNQITPNEEFSITGVNLTAKANIKKLRFLMEEPLELDASMIKALQLPAGLSTIAIGAYPILFKEDSLVITLKLL
jgi:hypothetical protein